MERTHICFYDRSKDGRFILDALDKEARIIYGCGMSGRAFKFGPVIGERLARFAVEAERDRQTWRSSGRGKGILPLVSRFLPHGANLGSVSVWIQ